MFFFSQGSSASTSSASAHFATSTTSSGPSSSHGEHRQYTDVKVLLLDHAKSVVDHSSEYILSIDRSTPERFWLGVTSFYKGAIAKPQKLKRPLAVNFVNTGEHGSDAGALKKEFFEDALREVNNQLFEGEDELRVPKKDLGLELLFEVAGMLLGHSIIQDGPAFPCLSVPIFDYVSCGTCYPTKDDIPLNISTHELITLIEKVTTISAL